MSGDIQEDGWIGRIPEKYRPFALLARLDRPIGIWLLLLPALWGITLAWADGLGSGLYAAVLTVLFAIGAVAMRGAGCVINDLWDRKIDAQVERTKDRPLARGDVMTGDALIFLGILLMAGLVVLLLLGPTAIMLGMVVVPLIVLYPLAKRFTDWPQAVLGIVFNFGALMGWAAMADTVSWPAVLLYAAGIFWTLGYDTVYAHQDKEDDVLVGVRSTALLFAQNSRVFVSGFYAAAFLCIFLSMLACGVSAYSYAGLAGAAAHMAWQMLRWAPEDPQSSLTVFRSNRDFGLIIWGVMIAAAVLS